MKPKSTLRSFLLGCSSLLVASSLHAADVTWDIVPGTVGVGDSSITGGTGTWDTANGNWTVDGGVNNVAWNNATNDLALFTDTAGTVTLGSAITTQGMKFIVGGYTVEGAGNTITLAGNGDDRIGDSPGPSISLDDSGTSTINANIDNNGKLLTIVGDRSSGRNIVVSGVISGSGGLDTYEGISATLTGANTYTGQTKINAATTTGSELSVSSLNSVAVPPQMPSSSLGVPADAAAGTIEIGNTGKQASCSLIYTGPGETTDRVIAYRMNGSPRDYKIQNDGTGLLKFTSKPTRAGATTGNTVLAGSADGEFELGLPSNFNLIKKQGAGTWTLGGTSEPAGATVTGGTLIVDGTIHTVGTVAVSSSSTLTVNGSLSFGTTTISNTATVDGSGSLVFDIDGTTSDLVDMSGGTLDLSGLTLSVVEAGSGANQSAYILIDSVGGGSYSGTFASESIPSGYSVDYDYDGFGTQVALVSTGGSAYDTWAGGAVFTDDDNGDGVTNGLAFLLGAVDPDEIATDRLPTVSESGGGLIMTFNCLPVASRGTATLRVEHSSDLGISDAWVGADVPDSTGGPVNDVSFVVGSGPVGPPALNSVTATIDSAAASGGKLFGRLKGDQP